MHSRNEAIITAAGSSKRIGNSIKKEYFFVNNKPILAYSIDAFIKTGKFKKIIITIPAGDEEQVKSLLSRFIDLSMLKLVIGGATRQESVYNGLLEMENSNPGIVLIHDGARPWITSALIIEVLKTTEQYGSCIPVIDMIDSLIEVDEQGCITRNLNREKIKAVQTPQGFSFPEILKAHKQAKLHDIRGADDSVLYKQLYPVVYTIPGHISNKKITFKSDLDV